MYEDIKEQFKKVISYSQGIDDPKVDTLFDMWMVAKEKFINMFGGLIYEWPEPIEFTLDEKDKKNKVDGFIDNIAVSYQNKPLADFIIANSDSFFDNIVKNNDDHEEIPKGMKLIKAFKYFEKDKDIEYFLINFDFVFDERYRVARTPVESKLFDENQIFSKSCIEPFNEVFILSNCLGIESELKEMHEININDHEEQALLRSALMKKILVKIIIKNKTLSDTNKTAKLIQNIKDYIYKNSDKKLTNMSVANHFGYHPYYLNNLFSSYENITLHNYINKIRIITAKEKLSLTDKPISVISCEMGFADCSYFSAFFRKTTGTTPKEYRNLCK
jgi:YesN/AraC family two-component response regulator